MIVAAIAVLSAGTLAAQRPGRPGGWGAGQQGTPPTPEEMQQRHIDRLAVVLSLTEAQKAEAGKIFAAAAQQSLPVREKIQSANTAIQDAVKAGNTVAIDSHAAELGRLTGEMRAAHAKASAAFLKLLTAEQRTKWETLGGGRGMGMGHGMGPGGMGMGAGPMGGQRPMRRAPQL